MEQLTFLKCRDAEPTVHGPDGAQQKRGRYSAPATMHGVSVSDHGEKGRWSNVDYWEMRKKKLEEQTVDLDLYGAVASRLSGGVKSSSSAPLGKVAASQIFASCHLYFDGRVDGGGGEGLSAFGLGKLARLHGAHVGPVLTKRGVTHVICTQLSGSKEKQALRSASSSNNKCQYFVLPSWITESIAANRRLAESRFSLLAKIAAAARIAKPLSWDLNMPVRDPSQSWRVALAEESAKVEWCRAISMENTARVRPDIAARAERSRSRPRGLRPGRIRTRCARASAVLPVAPPASCLTPVPPIAARRDCDGSPVPQLVPIRPVSARLSAVELVAIDDSPESSRIPSAAADPDGSPQNAAPTQLDSSEDDADDKHCGKGHEVWLADALGIQFKPTQAKNIDGPKGFRRSLAFGA